MLNIRFIGYFSSFFIAKPQPDPVVHILNEKEVMNLIKTAKHGNVRP